MTAILAQLPHCDPQDSATPMRVASSGLQKRIKQQKKPRTQQWHKLKSAQLPHCELKVATRKKNLHTWQKRRTTLMQPLHCEAEQRHAKDNKITNYAQRGNTEQHWRKHATAKRKQWNETPSFRKPSPSIFRATLCPAKQKNCTHPLSHKSAGVAKVKLSKSWSYENDGFARDFHCKLQLQKPRASFVKTNLWCKTSFQNIPKVQAEVVKTRSVRAWVKEWVIVGEWVRADVGACLRACVGGLLSEWMSQWVSEWVSERVRDWVCTLCMCAHRLEERLRCINQMHLHNIYIYIHVLWL